MFRAVGAQHETSYSLTHLAYETGGSTRDTNRSDIMAFLLRVESSPYKYYIVIMVVIL